MNDPHTKPGLVLAVGDDGNIHCVRENLCKGVVIETMDLLRPSVATEGPGKKINSGLAIAAARLTCGAAARLTCGAAPRLTCGAAPRLTCGAAPRLTCGAAPRLTCGAAARLTCGAAPRLTCGAAPLYTPSIMLQAAAGPARFRTLSSSSRGIGIFIAIISGLIITEPEGARG